MRRQDLADRHGRILRRRDTLAFLAAALFLQPAAAQTFPAFNWVQKLSPSGLDNFSGLATDANGNIYVTGTTRSTSFPVQNAIQDHPATPGSLSIVVTKLDSSGDIVYSTYFGGTADNIPAAIAVDSEGHAYITGQTWSSDFPTTAGSYASVPPPPGAPGPFVTNDGSVFLFKLAPDGSLVYSTYVTSAAGQSIPTAIALDSSGSAYITGRSAGKLQTTPGIYQPNCNCPGTPAGGFGIPSYDGFLARLDASGSQLLFATYLGVINANAAGIAVAPDGSAYVGTASGVLRFDSTGSTLLARSSATIQVHAMVLAPDGRVYAAGPAGSGFQATPGAFQTSSQVRPVLPTQGADSLPLAVAVFDGSLQNTVTATYFGDPFYGPQVKTMALDQAGNVYIGGNHPRHALPTRTPLVEGFGGSLATGFVSELSRDLSSLLFSSYFGNGEFFGVTGLADGTNGAIVFGGATDHGEVWVNSIQPAAPPALRIDSVVNAASLLDDPLSAGEVIVIRGAGFSPDAQVSVNATLLSRTKVAPGAITAMIPANLPNIPVSVQVQSAGASSNSVLLNVAAASPGLFSVDGTGFGQGYILNQDGTLNSSNHPAKPGDVILIFATGVGNPIQSNQVSIDGFPAELVSGTFALAPALVGSGASVYQLTVRIPDPASMAATNPNLQGFTFPPQVGVILSVAGASSQNGLALSMAQ